MKKLMLGLLLVGACGQGAQTEGESSDALLTRAGIPLPRIQGLKLRFPIHSADRGLIAGTPIVGQDHDPATSDDKMDCTNAGGFGFPFCYNEHDGTDYLLVGGFPQMDAYSPRVVAAAPGVVIEVEDNQFDRCDADPRTLEVTCHGHPMVPNKVVIRHENGWTTHYFHLKAHSVAVAVGQQVSCGQELGRIGSSGKSSMPHLHFGLRDPSGTLIDPYSGPRSQSTSYWTLQAAPDGLPGGLCAGDLATVTCGVVAVADAAACGTVAATNMFLCGFEDVISAATCGSDLVTSAAECGEDVVTSAVDCGTQTVTSAAQCGTSVITGLAECLARGLSGRTCSVPNTCTVANTCRVPRSCYVPRTCTVTATCEVPASCWQRRCY